MDLHQEFVKIYDENVDRIYRFVLLKLGKKELAEDLTSEVFIRYWHIFSNPKSVTIKNHTAYLYKIARNLLTDYYRRKRYTKTLPIEDLDLPSAESGPEEKAHISAEIERIKKALLRLNQEYQDLIIWYYLEDMPISDIASILEKSEEAVRMQISRAVASLREELQGLQEE